LVAAEQFRVGRELFLRHPHEDMEMVAEDGIGEDLDSAKIGDLPELFAQNLLRWIVQDSFAVHRAGHAMVNCLTHLWVHFDACRSHRALRV